MRIHATLPNGKKKPHGEYRNGIFTRRIGPQTVRWSDKTIPLNSSVIPQLDKLKCQHLSFIYIGAKDKTIYGISYKKAKAVGEMVTNEHGERDLRIPLVACSVKDVIPYQAKEEGAEVEIVKPSQEALFKVNTENR